MNVSHFSFSREIGRTSLDEIESSLNGHLMTILRKTDSSQEEKSKLIKKILMEVLETNSNYTVIEFQKKYINELESENQLLSQSVDELLEKCNDLKRLVQTFMENLEGFKQEKETIEGENVQLQEAIDGLMHLNEDLKNKQEHLEIQYFQLTQRLDQIDEENIQILKEKNFFKQNYNNLEEQLTLLIEEKKNLVNQQQELEKDLMRLKENLENLLEEQQDSITAYDKLKQEYEQLQLLYKELSKTNLTLKRQTENNELEKNKEERINRLDHLGYLSTGMIFTAGITLFGTFPAFILGTTIYSLYKLGKYRYQQELEARLKQYAEGHPGATEKECFEQVIYLMKK